jgi:hypothetical protein
LENVKEKRINEGKRKENWKEKDKKCKPRQNQGNKGIQGVNINN